MSEKGEVLGIFFLNLIRLVKIKRGVVELQRVLAASGMEGMDVLPLLKYDEDVFRKFLNICAASLGMEEEALEIYIGQNAYYGFKKLYPGYFDEMTKENSLELAVSMLARIYGNAHDFVSLEKDERGRYVISHGGSWRMCNLLKGLFLRIEEVQGLRPVVHETSCKWKGDKTCRMVVSFKDPPSNSGDKVGS